MQQSSPPKKFEFVGGALCLDFCNTVGGKRGVVAREKLETYFDLLCWSQQAALLNHQQVRALAQRAADRPQEAATILGRAIDLREGLYGMFLGIAQSKRPASADLARLNCELARNQGRRQVIRLNSSGAYDWQWSGLGESLENLLGPVSHSAAELLLAKGKLSQVRQCGGETCGWLFIDASKNHSRRWCDMRDCGNRAKVRRHRLKQQASQ